LQYLTEEENEKFRVVEAEAELLSKQNIEVQRQAKEIHEIKS
jgi:hypothetical protein